MSNLRSTLRAASILLLVQTLLAGAAAADWTVYGAGFIGISTGKAEVTAPEPGNPTVGVTQGDRDSAPMIAGSAGLEIPMDELMAWKLPYGLELPDWPVRPEIEFAGLRDFEYRTLVNDSMVGFDDVFLSSTKSWAMMVNIWFDTPTTVFTRPLAWAFQTRRASVRRALDPITWYAGVGVGTARINLDAVATTAEEAKSDDFKFAWQVGTGFGYQLTPFVNVDLGYRFFKARELTPTLTDSVGNPVTGEYRLKESVHEFRAGLRVNIYSFTSPWARLE
jgi:hypothetical protein